MKYFVIHSEDTYLLARFSMELQMEGYDQFCDYHHPFYNNEYLIVYPSKSFSFYSHSGATEILYTRFTLTKRNYSKVLQTVLNQQL